jgi:hypothetical protein
MLRIFEIGSKTLLLLFARASPVTKCRERAEEGLVEREFFYTRMNT